MTTKLEVLKKLEAVDSDIHWLLRNAESVEKLSENLQWCQTLYRNLKRLQELQSKIDEQRTFQDADGIEIEQAFDEF